MCHESLPQYVGSLLEPYIELAPINMRCANGNTGVDAAGYRVAAATEINSTGSATGSVSTVVFRIERKPERAVIVVSRSFVE